MTLSPGIPTSFVPRQPSQQPSKRPHSAGRNIFLLVSFFLFIVAVVAAVGTFAYDRYLTHVLEKRAAELALAQRAVNQDQVEEFIRLRDRLLYGQEFLADHVVMSQVFDVLEAQTLQTVRFESLELTVASDRTAQLDIDGVARNFNALAAQSNAFAADKRIRRAIFSDIVVNDSNTVSFRLTADLDPRLLTLSDLPIDNVAPVAPQNPAPQNPAPQAPAATTTP